LGRITGNQLPYPGNILTHFGQISCTFPFKKAVCPSVNDLLGLVCRYVNVLRLSEHTKKNESSGLAPTQIRDDSSLSSKDGLKKLAGQMKTAVVA
jgi:hypothetical protein